MDEREPQEPADVDGFNRHVRDLYGRADAIVREAEERARSLEPAEAGRYLAEVATRLAAEVFHDGALGPATAMLNPRPYLERLRAAFRFERVERPAPADREAFLRRAAERLGPHRRVEREDEVELMADVGPDVDKWVGGAVPRVVVGPETVVVDAPAGMI
jgi:hypothetical protein